MAQVHFTLYHEGLRAKLSRLIEKSTWRPTWHGVNNVSWSTTYLVNLGASKSGGSNVNFGFW